MPNTARLVGKYVPEKLVYKIRFDWTSDSGAAEIETDFEVPGHLERVVTVPGTGDDKPSDNYSITLKDEHGLDLLDGQGSANRDDTNAEQIFPRFGTEDLVGSNTYGQLFQPLICGKLTLNVSGAGASNQGTVYVYIS